MQAKGRTRHAILLPPRPMHMTVALGLLLILGLAQTGLAQTNQLEFGNNYFVTGDYVVGGVGLRGTGVNGFATGTISIPDANPGISGAKSVPPGAQIVAALLYWVTVESSQTEFAGQNGFFRGYPITGKRLGDPNAPVSWSSGGCAGDAKGSKTMRVYRADVRPFLPVDEDGNIHANGSYEVRLADSGSNGGGTPLTLGATLVIIYRVISPDFPLNSVVIYDGAFSPANGSATMTLSMQGFYQAAASPVSKLTHIVGNGQDKKSQTVFLNNIPLSSLYGDLPAFPGFYNGSWDNPTWSFSGNLNPVLANDASATTMVMPTSNSSGCVSWGAVILSTTVQDSDNDGLINVWEQNQGYCDASVNGGVCTPTDTSWVALPGADQNQKDIFVQLDYMCRTLNPDGTCDSTNPMEVHLPQALALTKTSDAFAAQGITLHSIIGNPIEEERCTDASPNLCAYPNEWGVVGWKAGFNFLKNQLIDPVSKHVCDTTDPNATCIRRFQHGRKDSYHYAIFGHALGLPEWGFQAGNLTSVEASGTTVTITTSSPHGLMPGDRVTIADALTNPSLNGTYFVQILSGNAFTIQIATATNANYTRATDPWLSVASGHVRSGSGFSDVGGADTLTSLGLWGVAGGTWQVQGGTFMHELGHAIGLTHGGFFFDARNPSLPVYQRDYTPTVEANCKSNFQSVMSYFFQVDLLLDPNGQQVLDYSGQSLNTLNEQTLSLVLGLTPTPTAYSSTKWYTPVSPGVGTAATRHCDGTPLTGSEPPMFRLEGATNPILPAWTDLQDINFDAMTNASLRGYNDWANLDLRQIGATGSDTLGGGGSFGFGAGSFGFGAGSFGFGAGSFGFGAGSFGFGAGSFGFGAGSFGFGAGSFGFGAGSFGFGAGTGDSELTVEAAGSVVRPPRNLTASVTPPPRQIRLNWDEQILTFGQFVKYNIYRGVNAQPGTTPYASVSGKTNTTFLDQNVICGPTYTYFVTAVEFDPQENEERESVPSNTVSQTACAPPYVFTGFHRPMETADPPNTGSYSGTFNSSKSITAKWTLQDSDGNLVTDVNVNTLVAVGPFQPMQDGTCRTTQVPVFAGCSGNSCPANAVVLFSPSGSKGNSSLRFSKNQFVFNWDTKTTPPDPNLGPCYVLELDLDSGQVERTGVKLE